MSRNQPIFISAMCLLILGACGPTEDGPGSGGIAPSQTLDSAGVMLHIHDRDAHDRAPRLQVDTVRPLAAFGGPDTNDIPVSGMFGFALLADHSLVANHREAGDVIFLSPAGQLVARHKNPLTDDGRFGLLVTLAAGGGDTAIATDITGSIAHQIRAGGGVISTRILVLRDSTNFQAVAGRLSDGTWLFRPGYLTGGDPTRATGAAPERRPPMAIGRWRDGGELSRFDTLLVLPGWETVRAQLPTPEGRQWADLHPAFAARPYVAAWMGDAAIAINDGWSIQRHDGDGALRSIIRLNAPRKAVDDSLKQRIAAQMRGEAASTWAGHVDSIQRVAEVDSVVAAMIFADSIAPYERMHLAPGRRLWLQETAIAPGDPARLIGFEPDGTIVGRLEVPLPPGGQIAAMGDDRVVVRVTVPDRRSYVRVWRIRELRTVN